MEIKVQISVRSEAGQPELIQQVIESTRAVLSEFGWKAEASDPCIKSSLTTLNEVFDRVAMHAVRRNLLEIQAIAAGLPLLTVPIPWPCSDLEYEARFEAQLTQAREQYEINYWAKEFGVSPDELLSAVSTVGESEDKVRQHLASKSQPAVGSKSLTG